MDPIFTKKRWRSSETRAATDMDIKVRLAVAYRLVANLPDFGHLLMDRSGTMWVLFQKRQNPSETGWTLRTK